MECIRMHSNLASLSKNYLYGWMLVLVGISMAAHGWQFTKINLSCLLDFFTHTHTKCTRMHATHTHMHTRIHTHACTRTNGQLYKEKAYSRPYVLPVCRMNQYRLFLFPHLWFSFFEVVGVHTVVVGHCHATIADVFQWFLFLHFAVVGHVVHGILVFHLSFYREFFISTILYIILLSS